MGKEIDYFCGLVKFVRRFLEVCFYGCVFGEFCFEFVVIYDCEVDCYVICGFLMFVFGNLLL